MYFPIGHHCTISSMKQNSMLFIHRVKPHLCDMCHELFTNLNDFHHHGETLTHKDKPVIGNLIYAICATKYSLIKKRCALTKNHMDS